MRRHHRHYRSKNHHHFKSINRSPFYIKRRYRKPLVALIVAIVLYYVLIKVPEVAPVLKIVDWILFIVLAYFLFSVTFIILKKINKVDLRSDLNCWGLRVLGALFVGVGIWIIFSNTFLLLFTGYKFIFNNIIYVLSLCLLILGAFAEFRSLRRYPMVGIWFDK